MRSNYPVLFVVASLGGLALSTAASLAQPRPSGQLSGSVGGQSIDVALDCGAWSNQQQEVTTLGDDRGRSDANGDGIVFRFSHFAPVGHTSAEVELDGEIIQVQPAFRAEDDVQWVVTETGATFEGPSGAADDTPVSLVLDCAPRSPEDDGWIGQVTGTFDGAPVDEAMSCETWDDAMSTTERTHPDAAFALKLFLMRQKGMGTVEIETGGQSYQLLAAEGDLEIGDDTIQYTDTFRRDDDTRAEISLTFDCSARASLVSEPAIIEMEPLAGSLSPGEAFPFELSDIPGGDGDMIVISDENPGWLFTAMRTGDSVTLIAPGDAGGYFVEYLTAPDMTPAARMEIVVE